MPDAAETAAVDALVKHGGGSVSWLTQVARIALAAALPHLRAQWTAKVDAALRDWEAFDAWMEARPNSAKGRWTVNAANYLHDTLAGDGGEAP